MKTLPCPGLGTQWACGVGVADLHCWENLGIWKVPPLFARRSLAENPVLGGTPNSAPSAPCGNHRGQPSLPLECRFLQEGFRCPKSFNTVNSFDFSIMTRNILNMDGKTEAQRPQVTWPRPTAGGCWDQGQNSSRWMPEPGLWTVILALWLCG